MIQATLPVEIHEAEDLAEELTRIGYNLRPIRRASTRITKSVGRQRGNVLWSDTSREVIGQRGAAPQSTGDSQWTNFASW